MNLKHCFTGAFNGRRVLITGHTGFKGSWLTHWLLELGAEVAGLSLPATAQQPLCAQLNLPGRIQHWTGDIKDPATVRAAIEESRPDFIFHLAAQPLVRLSYAIPVETFATNVLGTTNVLEAVRQRKEPCVVIVVTTDKCYENREWLNSYREEDALGGYDPYSASKACAEIVTGAYRRSFFPSDGARLIASARAGNVIGGGDWALDRIVPDCIRSLVSGQPISVRNRFATRPWQHVLEPLSGYLWLATALQRAGSTGDIDHIRALSGAFNFGPQIDSNRSVAALVEEILRHWPGSWVDFTAPGQPHEAGRLNLAIDKAYHLLSWQPVWNFATTIQRTVDWYRSATASDTAVTSSVRTLTDGQLADFTETARTRQIPWAV